MTLKKKSILLSKIGTLPKKSKTIPKKARKTSSKAVAIFDLSLSTSMKMKHGHDIAIRYSKLHNEICSLVAKKAKGIIIKEMGDGILVTFNDPINACRAALTARKILHTKKLNSKVSIAFGVVEEVKIWGKKDVLGSVIDRCARMEKFAYPNQILIDQTLFDSVSSFLKDYRDVKESRPFEVIIKGQGKTILYEISSNFPLKNSLDIPFKITEQGRLSVQEKVAFMNKAKSEVIEIGSGIREFTRYFTSRSPSDFKEPVKNLLSRGVVFRCFAVDPVWIQKVVKMSSREKEYYKQINQTLNQLHKIRKEFRQSGINTKFEIRTFRDIPRYHALCVDLNKPTGRMIISNYLPGIKKAECPVLQFSKSSNSKMFDTYYKSIRKIISSSRTWNP